MSKLLSILSLGLLFVGALSAKDASHRLTYWPKSGASMLYDHLDDPDETVNRAGDRKHAESYKKLRQHISNFE